ncbi:phage tail tape measure protein, partial [Methylovulum sp.]|uniref:phage tail tape measure protein n=1 Tax=Methylovulum sp. TaxID=1916980 RepID=UPI00263868B7
MSDLELRLRVSAQAGDAIRSFGELRRSVEATGRVAAAASTEATRLAQAYHTNRQETEALAVQQALGRRELDRLAQTAGRTSPEYRALAAELRQTAQELRDSESATRQSERAFAAARQRAAQLQQQLDTMRESVHRHREELRAQGVDVGNLSSEYIRLRREAEAAQAAQSGRRQIANDRNTLGLTAHGDTRGRMADIEAALARLRQSGQLTFAEMAQAELRASELSQELAHDLNGVGESFAGLQNDLLQFGAALAVVYATADQAIKFESGFAGVAKVVDASTGELAALSDELLKMTRSLPNAASEMLDIAASAGSLGIAADEVGAFTEGVAKLSAAFQMEVQATADYAAGIKNGFGLTVKQVLELGDAVNTLGNKYAATENDILNVDARIAASAKTFGLSAEQASALATTLLSLKNPPEVAATAINGLLSRLQSARVQSPEFQKALRAIGIDANQLATDIAANPQKALDGFLATLTKLDNASLAEATNQLIGQGGDATALQQLVQNLKQYQAAVGTATDKTQTAGAVEREFAAQMATTDAQLKLVKNAVVELAVNVGATLLPAITGAANAIKTFINALADAAKANPELAKTLAIFTPLIAGAGLLHGIGLRLAVMWGTVTAAFAAGGAASVAMSGGLGTVLAGVLRLIGGPIGLLILGLTTLADWWGRNKDKEVAWGGESVTVSDIVRTAWGYVMRAAAGMQAFLADRFGIMGDDLNRYAQGVKDAVNFVIGVFTGLGNGIGEGLAVFVEDVRRYFSQAVKLAQAAGDDIQAAMRLDFSGAHVAAQMAVNGQENKAAKERQNGAGFSHGLGTAFDSATKGDAVGSGIQSVVFKTGQAVSDWTTQWRGEFRAQIAQDKAQADAKAEAKKKQDKETNSTAGSGGNGADKGGADKGRHIDWGKDGAAAGTAGARGSSGTQGADTGQAAIRNQQTALDAAHQQDLQRLQNGRDAKDLALKQQVAAETLTETNYRTQVLMLDKTTLTEELRLKRQHLITIAGLEKQAVATDNNAKDAAQKTQAIEQDLQAKLDQLRMDGEAKGIALQGRELENARANADAQKALAAELSRAQQAAALSDLDFKRQTADQELELGNITQEQHLERLRELAAEELALRLKLLEDERKLHPNEPVSQAKISTEQQQAMIEFKGKWAGFDTKAIKNDMETAAGFFQPLQNAMNQSVNGVLTGQQTITKAVRNAAKSILLSYASTFLQERAMSLAHWAWESAHLLLNSRQQQALKKGDLAWTILLYAKEKVVKAGQWAWEQLHFRSKEADKIADKIAGEVAQTGAQEVGDVARTASTITAEETKKTVTAETASKSIMAKAYDAAAGVYQSLSGIPYVGWILAPIAAAATFITVAGWAAAVGSAKEGEWEVGKDESPFLLHRKESVLPAGVAENFRTVVNIVKSYVTTDMDKPLPVAAAPAAAPAPAAPETDKPLTGIAAPAPVIDKPLP